MKKALLFASLSIAGMSFGQCNEIFISEYVEGSGYSKAIELYNPTGSAINLAGYRLERFSNGQDNSVEGGVTNLTGTIQAFSTFVIVNNNATGVDPVILATGDQLDNQYPAPTYMNGNDAIVLFKNSAIVDIFGKTGDASMTTAYGWSDAFPYDGSAGANWTEDQTLIRKANVMQGVTVNPDPFIVTTQWDSLPRNTFSELGAHTCDCFLSVKELNKVALEVYPNPAGNGVAYINAAENIVSVTLVSLTGEVVLVLDNTTNSKLVKLNTEGLNKGVYMLKVNHGDSFSVSTSSLIIQ